MCALEDGPGADREVKLAFVAAVEASLAGRDAVLTGASWARNTFRPKTTLKVDAGGFFVWKHLEKLEGADCRTAHDNGLSAGLRTGPDYQSDAPLTVGSARRSLCNSLATVSSQVIALGCWSSADYLTIAILYFAKFTRIHLGGVLSGLGLDVSRISHPSIVITGCGYPVIVQMG
jgi:hypothetical protein